MTPFINHLEHDTRSNPALVHVAEPTCWEQGFGFVVLLKTHKRFNIFLPIFYALQVNKARRVADMKLFDDGFDDSMKMRKKQRLKILAEKNQKRNKIL